MSIFSGSVDTGNVLTLACGREAKVFCFRHDINDQAKMTAWAKHFRNHYCNDNQIDLIKAPGKQDQIIYLR